MDDKKNEVEGKKDTVLVKSYISKKLEDELDNEAGMLGMSRSEYINKCLETRTYYPKIDIPKEYDVAERRSVNIDVPMQAYNILKESAKSVHMRVGDYISWGVVAKGRPVMLMVDMPSRGMFSNRLNTIIHEVEAIEDVAYRSHSIYDSEMRVVIKDLREAIDLFAEEAARRDNKFLDAIIKKDHELGCWQRYEYQTKEEKEAKKAKDEEK